MFKYSSTRQISVNEPFCVSQAAWIGKEISAFNFTAIAILFVEVRFGRNPRRNKTLQQDRKLLQEAGVNNYCRSNTKQHMTSKAKVPSCLGSWIISVHITLLSLQHTGKLCNNKAEEQTHFGESFKSKH